MADADHVLVLTVHHIAFDGWSESVLLRELGECLEARAAGREPALPPLAIQYADYAAWQQAQLRDGRLAEQLDYWRTRLDGVRGILELPTDRPRSRRRQFRGARVRRQLPAELQGALKRLGRSHGVTPFMSLLAAWSVLMQRWAGTDDLVIGCPIAGRTRVELEGLIGCFINLFPVRVDLTCDPPFGELLARVRDAALGAFANQDTPFQSLLAAVRPERDPSRAPLFQVSFNLRNLPPATLRVPGLEVSEFELETGMSLLDLSLELTPRADGLEAALQYDSDLFEPATAGRMLGQYRTLLDAIVADPGRRLSDLPILSDDERSLVLRLGRGETVPPPATTVHQLVGEQAERTPDAVAVALGDRELTYREFDRASNRLAHRLRALGVTRGDIVAICLERTPDFAVAMLAVLRSGAAWCPLDPALPDGRLAGMVEDARPRVVITVSPHRARLSAAAATLCLDTERPAIEDEPAHDPAVDVSDGDVAYVIYTSGSTGRPKGALISHAAFRNTVLALARMFELGPADRVVQFAALGFDAVVAQTFSPWVAGATVVLRTDAWIASHAALRAAIERERITVLFLTAALWNEWAPALAAAGERLPESVRLAITAGERAAADAFRNWRAASGESVCWLNAYGPTEAAVAATVWDSRERTADAGDPADIPIGRPLPNTHVLVLDPRGRPVPVGVPGELYIGGAGVGVGYLNRPELTAERFVPDPFADDANARMYRTGDRARFLPDGNLQFLSRLDRQVKLRGFRVEPGEIEAVLRRHPGIANAVVTVRDEGAANARLVAFFVASGTDVPDAAALRLHLRDELPEYMVPAAFARLDALPVGPNGKLDYRALEALDPAPADATPATHVAPRNAAERRMAGIWEELLGASRIGVTDDFFELGGHSLLALELGGRIEEAFGAGVPMSALFERATIEHLVGRLAAPAVASPLVPVQPEGAKRPFFCVHEFFGDVFLYGRLARWLGPDQPFFGLQAAGPDGTLEPARDVPAMAASYVRALRSVQPAGPYAVGGLCAGGLVALEMAQQLRAAGEEVALVALLDTNAWTFADPPERPAPFRSALHFLRDLPRWLRGLGGLTPAQRRDLLRLKAGVLRERFRPGTPPSGPARDRRIHAIGQALRLSRQHRRFARAFRDALSAYRPGPYAGRIVLFRARMQPLFGSHDPAKGWRALAMGPFEIRHVPGNHLGMLQEPHVAVLARELAAALAHDEPPQEARRA
jgi:amino acid adenylation domain-containing protein